MEPTLTRPLTGADLRAARQARSLTQVELGARVGLTHNYVSVLENDELHRRLTEALRSIPIRDPLTNP